MFLYFILGLTALTATVQNVFKQRLNEKCPQSSAYFFSTLVSFVAMLFFIAINLFYQKDWSYQASLLLPSGAFAVAYAAATVFSVLAFLYGPLAKTSLIISCSLLLPSLYGICVQGIYIKVIRDQTATLSQAISQAVSPTLIFGTILLIVTLFLVNAEPKTQEAEPKKVSLRWLIFVILAFIGNGFCSIVQTAKQDFLGNDGNSVFMIVALALVVVLLMGATMLFRQERIYLKGTLQKGWLLAVLCGAANGLTNFFVMFLNERSFPASVLFPVVSGGGLLLIFLWSVFVKKERFTPLQYVGYGLGVISLVLLNL